MIISKPFDVRTDLPIIDQMEFRPEDIDEIEAATGMPFRKGLRVTLLDPTYEGWIEIAYKDDEPFMVHGLRRFAPDAGICWAVGTDLIKGKEVVKWGQGNVARMLEEYPLIFNFIDVRNKVHIRWLKWAGFVFTGRYVHLNGHRFEHFYKVRQ